jgi:arabinogalactan oligomer/maltooligosaccharide transport system permease protein
VFDESPGRPANARPVPALDTPPSVAAYRFLQSLHDEYRVVPGNCDYDLADSLFKSGRAAMIINGDWSWIDYLNNPAIDAAVAVLPVVSSTGLPMKPMIMPKGFSLNANATTEEAAAAMAFVKHMTSPSVQRRLVEKLRMIPARQSIYDESLQSTDPTYLVSRAQAEHSRLIPVATELRGVWDAMKPQYQALLGSATTPEAAAAAMQRSAIHNIDLMHRRVAPGRSMSALRIIGLLLAVGWICLQRGRFAQFARDWRRNPMAYLCVLPAAVAILVVVVFPLVYNVVLSLSDMSLVHFQDWRMVGLQNYVELFTDPRLGDIFVKTIVWTVVSVAFHLAIGLVLAVALSGPLLGRRLYQLLLIIPWAVPAYVTALTWRGMFSYEYGAVNLMLEKLQQVPPLAWVLELLQLTAPVNWLGDAAHAFQACITANVWLGFPFLMLVALGGMQSIPLELYEAAKVDRAGRWQQFWHITLPLLKPVLIPAVTLSVIWTFNNLNVIWLVSNGGQPQDSTHILVSYIYKSAFDLYRYGFGAALSMVIFALLLVFALVFIHRSRVVEPVCG